MLDLRRLISAPTIALAGAAALSAAGVAQAAVPKQLTVHLHTQPAVVMRGGKILAKQPSQPKLGDLLFQVATISMGADAGGKKIGREDVFCGFMSPSREICTVVDVLPGGTVVHDGAYDATQPVFLDAIVGGTGRYAAVRGTAKARFTGALDATQVYHFIG
jgi:hypothetical protein